ncbi:hypothetical protein [Xenorhabdus szentirmaii]|nr:hypothetical protein [Xenorhabdus szentirmaii]PHM30908.1 hypothetical protein Xsze_04026 [Xenorhabdus szentirmaii DSM 16338]PHM44496.1 hypothetical protein Xszus_04332 [Xenorhabdus szentirmaii]
MSCPYCVISRLWIIPDSFHRRTAGYCLTISASKSAQMYHVVCSPLQATGDLFRHLMLILTGDGSLKIVTT